MFTAFQSRLTDLDTKLFELDKEQLKLKLAVPANIGESSMKLVIGRPAVDNQMQELQADVQSM